MAVKFTSPSRTFFAKFLTPHYSDMVAISLELIIDQMYRCMNASLWINALMRHYFQGLVEIW